MELARTPLAGNHRYIVFVILCCAPLAAGTLWAIFGNSLPYHDFICYWGAARVFLAHHNPYATRPLSDVEHAAGWPYSNPMLMLCPPWALPVFASAGLLPFRTAQAVWLAISFGLNGISAVALWIYFGGAKRSCWIAGLILLTLMPMGTAERMGQPTPLILASLVGFLFLVRSERWFLAGIFLLPTLGLKPHLLWLVAAAVILWSLQERKPRLLAGAIFALVSAATLAFAYDPSALHYFGRAYAVTVAADSGFGGALRLAFGLQRMWLQYLPCAFGAAWFAFYWVRHRRVWSWQEHLPLTLLVSIASAPYCWFHDFILAMPAFIAVAVRGAYRSTLVLAAWLVVQTLILLPESKAIESAMSALWIPFWLLAMFEVPKQRVDSEPEAVAVAC